ncbi:MAG: hypothetical protein QM687_05180 [Ferruginibacter sp.]
MDLLTEDVKMSDTCKKLVQKAAYQYKRIAVLFGSLTILVMSLNLFIIYKYAFKSYSSWLADFSFKITPVYMIVYLIMSTFQVYYYYTGVQLQNKALDNNDQAMFEQSFAHYVKGNNMSMLAMGFYLVFTLITCYGTFIG